VRQAEVQALAVVHHLRLHLLQHLVVVAVVEAAAVAVTAEAGNASFTQEKI
jgi:hypothetical protein